MKIEQELPPLLPNNEIILKDAASLLKSDFVELYSEIGYDKQKVGIAWHTLRGSGKGIEMRTKIKGVSTLDKSMIKEEAEEKRNLLLSNVKPEVKMNKPETKKESAGSAEIAEGQPEVAEVKKEKPAKVKKEKPAPTGEEKPKRKKGALKDEINKLIEAGETDWKAIVEKTNSSPHFAKWLLKQSKKKAETDAVVE